VETDKPVVKIGATLPLSGDLAEVGEANLQSMKMALNEWQNKDTKYHYEIVFENDLMQSKKAALNASKFINADRVKSIFSIWGVVAPVTAEVARKNNILNFVCAAMPGITDSNHVLNNYTQEEEIFKTLSKWLHSNDVKSVAYVTTNAGFFAGRAKYAKDFLENEGFAVTDIEIYAPDTKDFRMSIAAMEKKKPDYYIVAITNPGTVLFLEQFYQVTKNKKNLVGIDVFHEMPQEYWPVANGLFFVKSANGTPSFAEKFKAQTGLGLLSCTGNSYDNLNLFIWGYENTLTPEGEIFPNTKDVFQTIVGKKQGEGAMGHFTIDKTGLIRSEASLQKMVNGQIVDVLEYKQ
jgi:ABC-type branched-subunit amino acid transport system substrate-binding protein